MKKNIKILLIAVLMLQVVAVAADEYIPPPPGPYQSTVVIDVVEGDALQKHQVYKFPQAELFESNEPGYSRPNTPLPLSAVPEKSMQNSSTGYKDPQIDTIMPPLNQPYPGSNRDPATLPWYGSQANNNPWVTGTPPQGHPYSGGWNYQNYDYGYYYPYPNQYRREKNMFNLPFSSMPSPWNVQPSQPYMGR